MNCGEAEFSTVAQPVTKFHVDQRHLLVSSPLPDPSIAGVFDHMEKPDYTSGPDKFALFVCHRHNHVPVLHIRKARSVGRGNEVSYGQQTMGRIDA